MTIKRYGLALAVGLLGISTAAYAAGLWPDYPVVGGASYCAGTSSSATGTIIGAITGCPNTVPAGPTVLTGNEQIPADTRLSGGASPQTVLVPMAALNALPITNINVTTASPSISATNTMGGVVFRSSTTITAANITLPSAPQDGQQFSVSSNRTITTLSVTGANTTSEMGANVAPVVLTVTSSSTAPTGFRFIFNAADTSWYRLY